MEASRKGRTRLSPSESNRGFGAVGVNRCVSDPVFENEPHQVQPSKTVGEYRTMAIDNPADKIREIIGEHNDELLDALVQVGAVFQPVIAVASAVKGVLDRGARDHAYAPRFVLSVPRWNDWRARSPKMPTKH